MNWLSCQQWKIYRPWIAPEQEFIKYLSQLSDWCESNFRKSRCSTGLLTSCDCMPFLSTTEHIVRHFKLSCPTVRPHRRQPTRLPRPWDSPGKNTGVGCHFLLQCMKVKSESEVAQSCLTLSDPMDCSLPGSSVHGIFQARVLEWGAIAFSCLELVNPIKPFCKPFETLLCGMPCKKESANCHVFRSIE